MDGTPISRAEYHSYLEERTLFEGYCPLEYSSDDHWVTEFTFNISNDGRRYTENFNVYTYQSLCQAYQNNSGNITFLFKVKLFVLGENNKSMIAFTLPQIYLYV